VCDNRLMRMYGPKKDDEMHVVNNTHGRCEK
jgi:hypothetical protein